MVRAGGSASRIIGDQGITDSGGGDGGSRRGQPAWQLPVRRGLRPSWASSTHAFPPLGSHPTEVCGQDNRQLPVQAKVVLGNRNPNCAGLSNRDGQGLIIGGPPVSGARKHGRGMRLAGGDRRFPQKLKNGQMKLSAVAEVYSSAVDDEGAPLVIHASKQQGAVVEVGSVWPGGECRGLVDGMTVPEPLEYSVVGMPIEVGNSSVD